MNLPVARVDQWRHEPEWLAALPVLVAECAAQWDLELEAPADTPISLVIPAGDVVLKLNAPSHVEAETEGDALALWDGHGAVRLVARDDERRALLIERCVPGTRLWDAGADELAVVGELLPRLQVKVADAAPFALLADEPTAGPKRCRDGSQRPARRSSAPSSKLRWTSIEPSIAGLATS